MKKWFGMTLCLLTLVAFAGTAMAQGGSKSKFYDFSDQVIDGEIKKPTALYTNARQKVKFDRLLSLKKSFLPAILETSKDKAFK
jgi:hypothetical protein